MGLDASDDGDGGGKSSHSSNVSCSICLEPVTHNGDRSWAKLQCGHEFHLDCIGSAFNIKGAMQCPNCRKIEKGQWLFATGCRSFPDMSFEDWPHDEDLYDLSYSEMSFGVQWCPITFPRLAASFEDGEFPSPAYQDLLGHHAVFAEHTAVSSSSHPCPYVAYYGPIHSSSSSSLESVSDSSSFSSHWAGPSGSSEIPSSYSFPPVEPPYHGWDHHSLPVSATGSRLVGSEQPSGPSMTQRSTRGHSDMPRNASFVHPFIASQRVGSTVTSSMIPPYPGSAARARDRAQALQAYFQPPSSSLPVRTPTMPSSRRSSGGGHRSMSQAGPTSDQMNGFYAYPPGTSSRNYPEPENSMPSRFHGWERDHVSSFPLTAVERESGWGGFHQPPSGPGGYRQRHASERNPPQNRQ